MEYGNSFVSPMGSATSSSAYALVSKKGGRESCTGRLATLDSVVISVVRAFRQKSIVMSQAILFIQMNGPKVLVSKDFNVMLSVDGQYYATSEQLCYCVKPVVTCEGVRWCTEV